MKYLYMIGILALVAGCQQQDAQIRNVLNSLCPSLDVAYAHYSAVSSLVSTRTQSRVELAKQQADLLCTGRATATTVTVMATGAVVYATVRDALREARSNGASTGYAGDLNKLESMLRNVQ